MAKKINSSTKVRVLAAVALAPVLLAVLFLAPKIMTAIMLSLFCAIGAYELLYGTGLVKHPRLTLYTAILAALVPFWCYYGHVMLWAKIALLAFFGLVFMEIMVSHLQVKFNQAAVCVAGAVLIPYLLCALVRLMVLPAGRYVIAIPFVLAFASDTGAYFVGCRFGRHKMAPVISPKKSVEGLFGGIASAIICMFLYCLIMDKGFDFDVKYGYALAYGFFGSLAGVFGDLCFSAVKRQTGIKDYGNLIPGHGGILDRFDSVLVVAPLVEILLEVLPVVVQNG